ncbi:MAG: ATP-dependent 6-phosphofructokinase [Anaerolineae bacterium]|nr:ATP-dependent 6-phosphofructokinase [Anaerolineae bacterium]
MTKRIGILTGGGDAPGLNAVIRAVALTAIRRYGWEVVGIREGFDGLYAGLPTIPLTEERVRDLLARGGTILGAANRGNPFALRVEHDDGSIEVADVSHEALTRIEALGLDGLIVAGGDGTMSIAHKLVLMGAKIVGVPKTIDNDLNETDVTFGFDTAIRTATEALDKLQTTAESHHRVMVLEVMGRHAGWIALTSGVSGGADAILIPEIPFDIEVVCQKIRDLQASGRHYSLVVVAEGAAPVGGEQLYYIEGKNGSEGRLGGIGHQVGNMLSQCVDAEVRVTVLGHVQRGGQPTARDRWLASRFGAAGVHYVAQEKWGYMVALQGTQMVSVPMDTVINLKFVDPKGDMVQMALDMGIVFG